MALPSHLSVHQVEPERMAGLPLTRGSPVYPWSNCTCRTGELARNANCPAPPQPVESEILGVESNNLCFNWPSW